MLKTQNLPVNFSILIANLNVTFLGHASVCVCVSVRAFTFARTLMTVIYIKLASIQLVVLNKRLSVSRVYEGEHHYTHATVIKHVTPSR